MSDPRQEDRLNAPKRQPSIVPTQLSDRIANRLSPCDDDLPYAQAMRQHVEMQKAASLFGQRHRRKATTKIEVGEPV